MIRALSVLAYTAFVLPTNAQDYSANSEAKTWNLYAEVPARFTATVTDPLCEFTGQCTPDCGAGRQQIVLIRQDDDVMVFPLKNNQPAFTGAAVELAPFCGQTVEVDGLMIDDPDIGATNVYLVQRMKPEGADWITANQWTKDWAARHPESEGKGPWFRRDPRVNAEIEAEGYLGLGPEVDGPFIADWFK